MSRDNRHFPRRGFGGGPTYDCGRCGKKTRETGGGESGNELCRQCLELCYNDNALADLVIDQATFDTREAKINAGERFYS